MPFVATFNQKKCDRPTLKLESKNLCEIITTTFNINITRMHHLVVLYLRFRNQSGCCLTLSLRLSESFFSCPSFYWSHGLDTPCTNQTCYDFTIPDIIVWTHIVINLKIPNKDRDINRFHLTLALTFPSLTPKPILKSPMNARMWSCNAAQWESYTFFFGGVSPSI